MVYSEQYIFKSSYHISSGTQDKLTKTTTCIIEKLKPRDLISLKKVLAYRQQTNVQSGIRVFQQCWRNSPECLFSCYQQLLLIAVRTKPGRESIDSTTHLQPLSLPSN